MRATAVLLLALCAALAEEDPKAIARALEIEAERALGEGRRADALKLLREAADVREGKRAAPAPARGPASTAASAELADMSAALRRGDAVAALKAGERARDALAAWSAELERAAELPVEERLDRLAKQIEELGRRIRQ